MTRRGGGKRVLYRRHEEGGSERYDAVGCWVGREPTPQEITELVPKQALRSSPS